MRTFRIAALLISLSTATSQYFEYLSLDARDLDDVLQSRGFYDDGDFLLRDIDTKYGFLEERSYYDNEETGFDSILSRDAESDPTWLEERDEYDDFSELTLRDLYEEYLELQSRASSTKTSGGKSRADSPDPALPDAGHPSDPPFPSGADLKKTHIWLRTDQNSVTYTPHPNVKHDELNELMKRICGKHVDLVYSNGNKFGQVGLEFTDNSWIKEKPNGDGAKVKAVMGPFQRGTLDHFDYRGHIDSSATINSEGECQV